MNIFPEPWILGVIDSACSVNLLLNPPTFPFNSGFSVGIFIVEDLKSRAENDLEVEPQ
jgi:hypothetical protein